ncbi:MAG: ATP cone domain-containing protein, partial [Lacrimispora sphenoides]
MIKVQKRDGRIVEYNRDKIITAIRKANAEVEASERAGEEMIDTILDHVERDNEGVISVEAIQDMIESSLVNKNKYTLSKKYIIYRYQRALLRKA